MDIKKLNEKLDYILSEAKIYRNKSIQKFNDNYVDIINPKNESLNETNTEINYYGVQYRNMRTGIHELLYTDTQENAEQILKYLKQMENLDSDIYSEEELEHQINFIWEEINKLDLGGFEINYRDVNEDGMYDDIYIINHADTKPDIYESLNEDVEENASKLAIFKKAYEALEELQDEVYGEIPIDDNKHLDPETVKFLDRLNKMIEEIYSRSLAFEDGLNEKHIENNLNEDLDNEEIYDKFKKAADAIKQIMDYLEDCVDPATGRMEFYTQGFYNNLKNMAIEIESNATAFLD